MENPDCSYKKVGYNIMDHVTIFGVFSGCKRFG